MMGIEEKTILVIDDEEAIRQSFTDYLEDMGYRILTAENGRVGVEMFDRQSADLVLVDLRMPEMDGLEVLAHISKKSPATPLIVVSGTGVISDAVEALHQGAWDYILKPVKDLSALAHSVDMAMEKARLKEENRLYQNHLEQMVAERTSELKRTTENLGRNEQQFRSILDNIRTGIIIVDITTKRIVYTNPKTAEIAEAAAEEINGSLYHDILDPDQKDDDSVPDLTQDTDSSEHILKTQSGMEVPIFKTSTHIHFNGKECLLVSFFDLSAQKEAMVEKEALEKQLRQAQKMESVGRLAGGVAHDYNNMLNVILGNAELAMKKLNKDDPIQSYLKAIIDAGNRSSAITRQLLAFARKQTVIPKILDLNEAIEGMLKMIHRLIGEHIDLVWLPKDNLWQVKMDPSQIDQILVNLCVNARDSISDVGKIIIETEMVTFDEAYCADHAGFSPGAFVHLSVSDNGSGMDREVLDNIFEPFFTTKTKGRGSGLGLATIYGIVKQNNGFINVYSEPGKGTTIKVYLPRYEGSAEVIDSEEISEPPLSNGETVLLVEDEAEMMEVTRVMLESLDYYVIAAAGPKEAIDVSKQYGSKIDALITDVVMPQMNGHVLSDKLKTFLPDIKTLFMSGYSENVIVHQGVLEEGINFIQKPFSMHDLAKKVRMALDGVKGTK